jgi:hypothetical protein
LRPLGPQPRRQPADDVERHAYFRLVGLGRSVFLRIAVDVHPVRPATGGRDQIGDFRKAGLRVAPELLQRMRLAAAFAGQRQKPFSNFSTACWQ